MTRSENQTEQDCAQARSEVSAKKEYHPPKLHHYGNIATLTAGNVNPLSGRDNPGNQKTA
jgi:hypothetical protein